MIRRAVVDEIGCFDEDFYMYCEDVDLCWRVNHKDLPGSKVEKGIADSGTSGRWHVVYYPEAVIYHLIGKSSDQAPTRMTYEFHRSQYLFYKKHYAASMPILIKPLILPGIALRALGQMARFRARYWQRCILGLETRKRSRHDHGKDGDNS
jgi:hypothetical protein